MNNKPAARTALLAGSVLYLSAMIAPTQAAESTGPYTLRIGSWVCTSLENHSNALAEQRKGIGAFKIQKAMNGECLYADDEFSEDIMPPHFVKVIKQDGDFAMVSFVLEHYRKVKFLHRKITRMQYTGWTPARNLESRF